MTGKFLISTSKYIFFVFRIFSKYIELFRYMFHFVIFFPVFFDFVYTIQFTGKLVSIKKNIGLLANENYGKFILPTI